MDFDLQAFVQVVDRGNFTVAGADLGLTPSAVSKLVSRLEDRLGVTLLQRTTRKIALTTEGETFYLRARDIIASITDAEAEVSQAGQKPRGRLRINCASGFAFHQLARTLPEFRLRYPDVEIELSVTDRVVDLLAENADVGIRSGAISDPSLVTRRISELQRALYASPTYLERRGIPASPKDLEQHDCVIHGLRPPFKWPLIVNGQLGQVELSRPIAVDNAETALRIAQAGGGITRTADMIADEALQQGWLVPVLSDFIVPDPVALSAVYPHGRHRMPKVRAFLDFLVEQYSNVPWKHSKAASATTQSN
ncbi:LysR family transcriptional regulator [Burkholderia sp. Ax-1724]|uniref:LysR family transcriptional regulator n=1 Tax=Burkholderia sp. Ax-1724 TaxID=2608336 RepID=UPI00141F11E9|nr:LysR family transcriptional regulator [Burkholderia sp. Ax-1724]NIF54855.1 LysR family transcriptional regulator [Burkholderia sp. Ax-1724]